MPAQRSVTVRHQGQNFTGAWFLTNGSVHVTSPYGSKSAPADSARPGSIADNLMREVVRSWAPVRAEM